MAIQPSFPTSPYEILDPEKIYRWFPADETLGKQAKKNCFRLSSKKKKKVKACATRYQGLSPTSKALLDCGSN
jgi:hypothetical protein